MSCPNLEQLEQLARGDVEPGRQGLLETHIAGCAACRDRLSEVAANLDLARRVAARPPAGPPPTRTVWKASGVTAPPSEPASGDEFPGYEIVREVGRGGMGVVYEALQNNPLRRVAIKVFQGQRPDETAPRLLQRETQALARLKHPSIATIHEAGRTRRGEHFFVMELIDGLTLDAHVRARTLPRAARLRLFVEIGRAVEYAHGQGVLHRDLKPDNILIDETGRPKILDFGLARVADHNISVTTEVGLIRGTLPYMSPEQARGDPARIDARSDVYALGVILYELLTETLPYALTGIVLPAAVRIICEQPPVAPSAINRDLRGDLETIVLKALEKDPERRYPSAATLADDVERFLHQQTIRARPPSTAYRLRKLVARHRPAAAALGTALALTGIMAALWFATKQPASVGPPAPPATSRPRVAYQEPAALCDAVPQIIARLKAPDAAAARQLLEDDLRRKEPKRNAPRPPPVEAIQAFLTRSELACVLDALGETGRAETEHRRAVNDANQLGTSRFGESAPAAVVRARYADFLARRGRAANSVQHEYETALHAAQQVPRERERDQALLVVYNAFGAFEAARGRWEAAEAHWLNAYEAGEKTQGSAEEKACLRARLAALYQALDKPDEARKYQAGE